MTHDWHWTFGNGVHISFPGGGAPVNQPNHAFSSNEGCATYSDANGNLLFYTEGARLYDAANTTINQPPAPPLGGTSSSAHAAIIVPPAGGGSLYHILTTGDWDSGGGNIGPLTHTSVKVSPGNPPAVTIVSGPTKLTGFGPQRAAEKLAAIPHVDCNKYWVVSIDIQAAPGDVTGVGTFYAMLIDSDTGPTGGNTVSQPYPYPVASSGYCIKFSPDGKLLALTDANTVDILNFNRSTGAVTAHSQIVKIPDLDRAYGVEFSPNGLYLYFTGLMSGYINRHTIGQSGSPPTTPFSSTSQIALWPTPGPPDNYKVGALQLAPNGKIYGTKVGQTSLFEIGIPDGPTANAGGVGFNMVATTSGGAPLTLTAKNSLGLPTFTRIADDCADNCRNLAAMVDEQIAQTPKVNALRPCDKSQPVQKPPCAPLDLPRIAPWTSIRWGDSKCDCIEGDDTEVMHLTVCNPYKNLTLSNLTIHQLLVVDMNGNPPPLLPDGSPSIQLVPIGPYCFDDLAPCTCVTRQFVLRLRGAIPGSYRIIVRGICFDACFHGDEEDCFVFEVCKD